MLLCPPRETQTPTLSCRKGLFFHLNYKRFILLVPPAGFEPARPFRPLNFKSSAFANFTMGALFVPRVGVEPTKLIVSKTTYYTSSLLSHLGVLFIL